MMLSCPRYKEAKYPENMDKFVIHNTSKIKAEIHFCFQHDTKATTFLLDPPNMTLEPNERKVCKFIYLIFCRVYFWDCLSWKPFFVVKNINLSCICSKQSN